MTFFFINSGIEKWNFISKLNLKKLHGSKIYQFKKFSFSPLLTLILRLLIIPFINKLKEDGLQFTHKRMKLLKKSFIIKNFTMQIHNEMHCAFSSIKPPSKLSDLLIYTHTRQYIDVEMTFLLLLCTSRRTISNNVSD
jgi:hypothetical protein